MNIITNFESHTCATAGWFIDQIQEALTMRDLTGLTNGNISSINVSGEHPLAKLLWIMLSNNEVAGTDIIPGVSVTEGDENEDARTISDKIEYQIVDESWLTTIEKYDLKERLNHGLITEKQISLIRSALNDNYDMVLAKKNTYHLRNNLVVSLWTDSSQIRDIIGMLLRSILFSLKSTMGKNGIKDVDIRIARGLLNANFGRKLLGQEFEIRFLDSFANYEIFTCSKAEAININPSLNITGNTNEEQ